MYESAELAKTIKKVARAKKILLKDMFEATGLSKHTLSNLNKGSMIGADSLAKIADYLDCSVDYLLGRSDEP